VGHATVTDPVNAVPSGSTDLTPRQVSGVVGNLPLYLVVFVGFLGYSLMITVFTPMILHNDNGMLAASSTTSERTIILGVLLSLYPAGQFLGAPVLGALSDRVGRRPVLLASLSAGCVGYALIATAVDMRSLWLLFVASFFGGLTEANISIAQSSIADTAAPADRNRLFGYVYLSASMAYVVGPLVGGQLANTNLVSWFHYQTPFIAAGILVLATLVGMFFWFPESRRSGVVGPGYLKSFTNLSTVFTDKRVRSLYLVNFLLYLAIFGFFRAYPMYLVDAFHLQVSRESAFVAFVAVPIVVANLWLVGALSRRFSTTTMTLVSGALTGLFMIVVPLPGILNLLWVTLGLTALGLSVCMPSCATMISLAVGDEEQGRVMGNNQSLQTGAEAVSGLAGGLLAAVMIQLPLLIFAVMALAGAGRLWFLRRSKPELTLS
jgi:DHA1 family tetracycline resistance protein-like MFS transporter